MRPRQHVLGVIGGLGPLATSYFLELVVEMTHAPREQDNLDMIVYNFPSIPDRTGYILGSNLRSPLPGLLSVARDLSRQGVDQIAIPCVTAHYFYDALQNAVPTPIINDVAETARYLKDQGVTRAGIMATDGTILSGLFANALKNEGIEPVVPSPERQADVMHLIYRNVKVGKDAEMDRFEAVREELCGNGAETIILGCTELSVIKRDHDIGHGFLDSMDILAQQSILRCGKPIKKQYRSLIT